MVLGGDPVSPKWIGLSSQGCGKNAHLVDKEFRYLMTTLHALSMALNC